MGSESGESDSAEDIGDVPGTEEISEELESEQEGIHRDDLFHLLQVSRRRDVVRYLEENPEELPLEVGKIATEITILEEGGSSQVTSEKRKRAYISLYQDHLEKMDDEDVLKYDGSSITGYGENFDIVAHYVDDGFEDPDEFVTEQDILGE